MPQLIGTAPNQVPTNGDLGTAAFMDSSAFYGTGNSASFRNRVINGDMRIDQRNSGATLTNQSTGGTYIVDRFRSAGNAPATGRWSMQRFNDAPPGFFNSVGITVTTAQSAFTGSENVAISHMIEGNNIADLGWGTSAAQPISFSFWVKSSVVGRYSVTVHNNSGSIAYPFAYTINAASTWEYKSVTIPGPTTGTWGTDVGLGIRLDFGITASPNNLGPTGLWTIADYSGTTANLFATNGNTFRLTGVQLEKGTVATPFEHRSFGTELASCMRYFYAIKSTGVGNGDGTGLNGVIGGNTAVHRTQAPHPVIMRATPSLTFSNISTQGTDLRVYDASTSPNITSVGSNFSNANAFQFDCTASSGGLTTGRAAVILWSNSITGGYIWVSAEI